ncbi:hypothetical protein [Streptomyces ortus]|uniref:Uncharacterized protein n=1 Tax=Streptomyces ortus TaxID=2867268 RepID=A0ABT3VEX3_9ACTN|nr:hypothetical protein [Streptomyces ortus]MCX4238421.1 hypothetical protein [Streptomyces ortus]
MSFLKFAGDEVLETAGTLESNGGRMKSASREVKRTGGTASHACPASATSDVPPSPAWSSPPPYCLRNAAAPS